MHFVYLVNLYQKLFPYLNFSGSFEIHCTRARLSSTFLTSLRFFLFVLLPKVISKNNFPSSEATNSPFLVNCFCFFYLTREQEDWFKDFGCLHLYRVKSKTFCFSTPRVLSNGGWNYSATSITSKVNSSPWLLQPSLSACGMICCSPLTFVHTGWKTDGRNTQSQDCLVQKDL